MADYLVPGASDGVMGFVDNDQIGVPVLPIQAPGQGLD